MDFDLFEREARRLFEAIPERYREGVDGLTVHRDPLRHPRFPGIYTLGECVTEAYPSSWGGPETVRSLVLLHWGSFRALAASSPRFDWSEEIWETLTHELRHHLESLADRDDLSGVDHAMEETFRRDRGLAFAPDYYHRGERAGAGVYVVEEDVYIEQFWKPAHFARTKRIRFNWAGRSYQIGRPLKLGDVHFIRIVDGIPPPPYLELVLVRRSSWLRRVLAVLRRAGVEVLDSDAAAVAVE